MIGPGADQQPGRIVHDGVQFALVAPDATTDRAPVDSDTIAFAELHAGALTGTVSMGCFGREGEIAGKDFAQPFFGDFSTALPDLQFGNSAGSLIGYCLEFMNIKPGTAAGRAYVNDRTEPIHLNHRCAIIRTSSRCQDPLHIHCYYGYLGNRLWCIK